MGGQTRDFNVGDLVFAKIPGYPWWPGQVMNPQHAERHVQSQQQPGKLLIAFCGDNSYGWCEPILLESFQEWYETKKHQKAPPSRVKSLKLAVEEAKEMWDRREARQPATNHDPVDFLRPETWMPGFGVDLETMQYPEPPTANDLATCSPAKALAWLRATAAAPLSDQGDEGLATSARSLLYSSIMHKAHAHTQASNDRSHKATLSSAAAPTPAAAAAEGSTAEKKRNPKCPKAADEGQQQEGEDIKHASKLKGSSKGKKLHAEGDEASAEAQTVKHKAKKPKIEPAGDSRSTDSKPKLKSKVKQEAARAATSSRQLPSAAAAAAAAAGAAAVKVEPKVESKVDPLAPEPTAAAPAEAAAEPEAADLYTRFGGPLSITFKGMLKLLHASALDPQRACRQLLNEKASMQTLVAAMLRYKEAAYTRSYLHRHNEIGYLTRGALEAVGALPPAPPEPAPLPQPAAADDTPNEAPGFGAASKQSPGAHGKRMAAGNGLAALEARQCARVALAKKRQRAGSEGISVGSNDILSDDEYDPFPRLGILTADEVEDAFAGVRPPAVTPRQGGRTAKPAAGPAGDTAGLERRPVMVEVKFKDYANRAVLANKEAFSADLQKWLGEKELPLPPRLKIQGVDFDLYQVFQLVAQHGGYQCVCAQGGWRMIANAWRPDFRGVPHVHKLVQQAYKKTLLAYEQNVAASAPIRTIKVEQRDSTGKLVYEVVPVREDKDEEDELSPKARKNSLGSKPGDRAHRGSGDLDKLTKKDSAKKDSQWLQDFDDLMVDDSKDASKSAASRQGKFVAKPRTAVPTKPSMSTDKAEESRTSGPKWDSEKRRVLIRYPEGTRLPTAVQVAHSLKRFGALTKDNITLDTIKSTMTIDFRKPEEAENAYTFLKKSAWSAFSEMRLERNANIAVSWVRMGEKFRPHPAESTASRPPFDRSRDRDRPHLGGPAGRGAGEWGLHGGHGAPFRGGMPGQDRPGHHPGGVGGPAGVRSPTGGPPQPTADPRRAATGAADVFNLGASYPPPPPPSDSSRAYPDVLQPPAPLFQPSGMEQAFRMEPVPGKPGVYQPVPVMVPAALPPVRDLSAPMSRPLFLQPVGPSPAFPAGLPLVPSLPFPAPNLGPPAMPPVAPPAAPPAPLPALPALSALLAQAPLHLQTPTQQQLSAPTIIPPAPASALAITSAPPMVVSGPPAAPAAPTSTAAAASTTPSSSAASILNTADLTQLLQSLQQLQPAAAAHLQPPSLPSQGGQVQQQLPKQQPPPQQQPLSLGAAGFGNDLVQLMSLMQNSAAAAQAPQT